jgi:type IV pilus assembly protein PilN
MVIPYMLQQRRLADLDVEMQQLQGEVAKLEQQAKEVKELDRKRIDLKAKLTVIEDLKRKRVGPVRIMEDLSSSTPEKLWLLDFNDVAGNATITGMALDNQTIAEFMRHLQQSKYFYDVDLVETSQAEQQRPGSASANAGLKKFIVKARLDYLGAGGKSQAPAPAGEAKKPS